MEGIVLIMVLAMTGGAIAYIGDRLGTRIGKRKMTVFGLRPRHTSTLITIVSGFFIVAATMAALAVVSQDVRTALFGMDKLKAELIGLGQEVGLKNKELAQNHQDLQAKTEEYALLNSKVVETSTRLKAVSGELQVVQQQRSQIEQQLMTVQAEYQAAKISYDKAQTEMTALAAMKTELDSRVASLTDAKGKLQGDIDHLEQVTANLRQGLKMVREGNIVFRSGELLYSGVMTSNTNQQDGEESLRQVLATANKGLLHKLEIETPDTDVLWVPQAEFDRIRKQLQEQPGEYVIRIVAAGNIIYGEPVIAALAVQPNVLVYKAGSPVYSQIINVGGREQDNSDALMFFLRQVNSSAIKQGVLPDPIQGTVGVMAGMEYYDIVSRMRQTVGTEGGRLRLMAVVPDDIYTQGPLRLTIRMEKVN